MLRNLCLLALGVCTAWAQDGGAIYKKRCAGCHDAPAERVAPPEPCIHSTLSQAVFIGYLQWTGR